MKAGRLGAMLLAAALAMPAVAAGPAASGLKVERVALLMRHGVRPPTKNPPMPAGIAAEAWPAWPVAPGWLTPHGTQAIGLLGAADRADFARAGLLPASGCPAEGAVAMISDSDQRTIATGDAYLATLAPGCAVANVHRAQDDPDPVFSRDDAEGFDPAAADRAVAQALGPGGVAAAERAEQAALATIDRVYCGAATTACGVTRKASGVAAAAPGKKPKLTGALDTGSTAAQILLLEYAEGKPLAEVGWGRATAADIARVGSLHSTEFRILARPGYMAAWNIQPIARRMLDALNGKGAPLSVVVGHDGNVASLAGLLDLHWQAPGFAKDDPTPGGALGLELLRDAGGRQLVRAYYRSQSLDGIRTLSTAKPYRVTIPIAGCAGKDGLCTLAAFNALVEKRLAAR